MINLLYGLTIFISAFLLFFIQPLIAKVMLPIFGGASFVWLATILFFQCVLLIGYGYAYLLTKYLSSFKQACVHLMLLIASLCFIPIHLHTNIAINNLWPPMAVLWLLILSIMLPCMVISASSPLLQHWYCNIRKTSFPYVFYSVSNAGSLIGLLCYPFVIEPLLGLKIQSLGWSSIYGLYFVLCFLCACKLWTFKKEKADKTYRARISYTHQFSWVGLTFLSSALLLSITQFLVQNIINMPLLWVLPLALYLISFIVVFAKDKHYDRQFWSLAFLIWLVLTLWLICHNQLAGLNAVMVVLGLLYSACMVCQGELIKLKPDNDDLALFYLYVAVGGVLGGIFANIIALLIFKNWWDLFLPLMIINSIVILLYYYQIKNLPSKWNILIGGFSFLTMSFLVGVVVYNTYFQNQTLIAQYRNPYGFIKVIENHFAQKEYNYRALMHGKVMHGLEFIDKDKKRWPTSYYGNGSGVGLAFEYLKEKNQPLKIGIVGLGAGIVDAYNKKGDEFIFYEIDNDIIKGALQYFNFISQAQGRTQIFLGDARIVLQRQLEKGSKQFSMLIIDAFNGDAIPAHLLTAQAMQLYRAHLAKNGIIALHTTNTYLDLMPVTLALANQQGCSQYWIRSTPEVMKGVFGATWSLISCDPELAPWLHQHHVDLRATRGTDPILWTDDKNSVLPLMKWQ